MVKKYNFKILNLKRLKLFETLKYSKLNAFENRWNFNFLFKNPWRAYVYHNIKYLFV